MTTKPEGTSADLSELVAATTKSILHTAGMTLAEVQVPASDPAMTSGAKAAAAEAKKKPVAR